MTDPSFGNLSFQRFTFDTETERLVIALQAALKVKGLDDFSLPIKCLKRLKRSMQKNKVKKYSFSVVTRDTSTSEEAPSDSSLPPDESSDAILKSLSSLMGVTFHFESQRLTSSRFRILNTKCVGKSDTVLPSLLPTAASALCVSGFSNVSFSVLKKVVHKDRGATALRVQCVYSIS